jgi:hypothetical protein
MLAETIRLIQVGIPLPFLDFSGLHCLRICTVTLKWAINASELKSDSYIFWYRILNSKLSAGEKITVLITIQTLQLIYLLSYSTKMEISHRNWQSRHVCCLHPNPDNYLIQSP